MLYYAPKNQPTCAPTAKDVLAQAMKVIITALIIPASQALPVRTYVLRAITVAIPTQGIMGIAAI